MVKKLSSGKLGLHKFEKNLELKSLRQDWRTLGTKLAELTNAVDRLRKMKRKPRLSDYIDLERLRDDLERLNLILIREYYLNVEGEETFESFDIEKELESLKKKNFEL